MSLKNSPHNILLRQASDFGTKDNENICVKDQILSVNNISRNKIICTIEIKKKNYRKWIFIIRQ